MRRAFLPDLGVVIPQAARLSRAARGVIHRVEVEDELLPPELLQFDLRPIGCHTGEIAGHICPLAFRRHLRSVSLASDSTWRSGRRSIAARLPPSCPPTRPNPGTSGS